jgi:hypothetical protein
MQSHGPRQGFCRWFKPLTLARGFGVALIVMALALPASAQSSVTLAWDSESGTVIAGYRLYQGAASRTYTNVINTGTATSSTVSGLVGGATYFFAITAVGTNGSESDYSSEISYTVPLPTNSPATTELTITANSGSISAPFVATFGNISQRIGTGVTNGGRAVFTFSLAKAGNYVVSAMVIAPRKGQNSLYVNIDAEPTDPLMVWDIPVSPTLTSRIVSWRGNGNADPASAQYSPKVFTLSAGTHQVIIRGQDANTTLGTVSIAVALPPQLQIHIASNRSAVLSGTGPGGQTYNIMASPDLKNWAVIGSVTADTSGVFTFTDPTGTSLPKRMYRLQSVVVAAPVLQIRLSGGLILLSGTGQGGKIYNVQASSDLTTWAVIGTVTADPSGLFNYADPMATNRPRWVYRLQGQ